MLSSLTPIPLFLITGPSFSCSPLLKQTKDAHEKACDVGEGPFSSFNNDQEAFKKKNVLGLKEAPMNTWHRGGNSRRRWLNTFINWKWILFDGPDNEGIKSHKAALKKGVIVWRWSGFGFSLLVMFGTTYSALPSSVSSFERGNGIIWGIQKVMFFFICIFNFC